MKKFLLPLISLGLFTGCQVGYVPTVVNTPLFEEKNQISASASLLTTMDAQVAYSITSKYYIFGDISYLLPEDGGVDGLSFSGGLGYYENFDDNSIFEFAAGAGLGRTEEVYSKFYIQPTVAWRLRNGELGFTLRGVLVNYPELIDGTEIYSASDLFFEPVANFRIGKRRAKIQFQIGPSIPVRYNSDVGFIPLVAGIGLNYRI